ncbi:MAG: GTP-binding protein, partial [Desulfobacterales bacterium]|nr:GTP-binding protein [Desulfobacterales bacterium]
MSTARQKGETIVDSKNPFNTGTPAKSDGFFGRRKILDEIKSFIRNPYEHNLLISGQRRIGKTSLLRKIQDEKNLHVFGKPIYFNLQNKAKIELSQLLFELADRITQDIDLKISLEKVQFYNEDSKHTFNTEFLPRVFENNAGNKPLILLFDEFDVIGDIGDIEYDPIISNYAYHQFIPFVESIIEEIPVTKYPIKFIFAIGRNYKDLDQSRYGQITKFGRKIELYYFDHEEYENMLKKLSDHIIPFEKDAVEEIYALTHGHPYFTQCLASSAFDVCEELDKKSVTKDVIDQILIPSVKSYSGPINWIWESFTPEFKIILYLMAIIKEETDSITVDNIRNKAVSLNLEPAIDELPVVLDKLIQLKVINEINKTGIYDFYVEYIRKWIVLEISKEKIEGLMDHIDEDINFFLINARYYYNKKEYAQSQEFYKKIIEKFPYHFEAVLFMGKCYQHLIIEDKNNVDQALTWFEQAFQLNPRKVKKEYADFLLRKLNFTKTIEEIENVVAKIKQIESSQKDGWGIKDESYNQALDLSHIQLAQLPPKIFELKNLQALNLSNNQLAQLPPEISELINLQTLDLTGNQLTQLPPEISELINLQTLDLGFNQLTQLPPEISELKNLRSLYMSSNQLIQLPPEISELKNLQTLHLTGNQLTQLPPEIFELKNLQTLHLAGNQLTQLPPEISELKNLLSLHLTGNQLTQLPPEISELKNLLSLVLSSNQLTQLPPETFELKNLLSLYMENNQLTHLPPNIAEWGMEIKWKSSYGGKGRNIFLEDNPLESPPVEIVRQGTEAVRNYFESIIEDTVRLYEAKFLIVGRGEVGKTCLMKKLMNPEYRVNLNEQSTDGVDIRKWYIRQPFEDQTIDFCVNLWDFGGQEIYHATHQFFLTKRSFYMIVWDARKEEDYLAFDYWLNVIKLLSGSSPTILVMNKADERIKELEQESITKKFPNVKRFYQVSALTGKGISDLRRDIREFMVQMPHIGDRLPKVWTDIRRNLENLNENYISYDRFREIAGKYSLNEKKADFLSDYFHDLGVFLHFRNEELLEHIVILKPEWGTNAVYNVLDDPT